METPVLETDRLRLRPFRRDDTEAVFSCWESDPDVARYMFWTSHNDIKKTKEWVLRELERIGSDTWYRFAVVLKDTDTLIGTVLVYYEDQVENWEIAYNFGKPYWGKGYATEAARKVIGFAADRLGISEIVGRYAKENPGSGNVLRKLGFQYEKEIPYPCNRETVLRQGIQCRLVLAGAERKT